MRYIKLVIALLFLPLTLSAQFYVTGDDPGKLKWNYIDTESYRVIYPQGADSLARVYGRKFEKYKVPVSRTSGYITGEGDGKIMPVVIHAFNDANGSVAWAPKRMDMFAVPSAYDPEPMPWSTMLSVHESRHVTQMQFGMTEKHKPGKWFLGQGWNILAFLLYPGTAKTEGDAVVAETALTPSGRGRTADFLNYFWVALDQGDTRKWFQWRYVSQLNYSPTYYALGYLTIGGFRYIYDYPYFVSDALHNVAEHPAKLGCLYNISKKVTGMEWEGMWQEVRDSMYGIWKADAEKRAPYISSERILAEPARYTDYTDLLVVGEDLYAIKEGHVHTPSLVRIDKDGNEYHETLFPKTASAPKWDENKGRIIWSETVQDERWTLKSDSKVRYLDSGRMKTLKNKAMLHNPSADGNRIATVEYRMDGHSYLDIIDSDRGNTLIEVNAPDTLQLVETAWLGGKVYVTAISDNGYGIYSVDPADGIWNVILSPQPVMVKDFKTYGSELIFTCDRTGVNELYHLNPTTGELRQKTSTRYGAADFTYSTDGSQLYYSSQTLKGKHIFRTSADSLMNRYVRFDSLYRYPLAERLKEQETAAAKAQGYAAAVTVKDEDVQISEPERYRKVPNMLNLHTWFPAYVSVDNIMKMSFDKVYQALSLGVSGVTQNHLATAVGEAGYSAHKDPYNPARWRHSGHAKFTYSGLYPVFEFSFDINDRSARQYFNHGNAGNGEIYMVNSNELAAPYVQGKVSMYIPFNLSSGGWHKGVIPRISYTITNDRFNTGTAYIEKGINGPKTMGNSFVYYKEGRNMLRQYLGGSVRGYATTGIANSQVYPRWGIGGETGVSAGLEGCEVFSPVGYLYGYGYVPGIIRTQGLKLTAMWQRKLVNSSAFCQQTVDFLPRGLSSIPALGSYLSIYNRDLFRITADYAIPIFIGDVTIGGNILAIKRLVLYPHYDHTFIGKNGLWSAGIDVTADLQAIATIEWPCSVGLSFCWNGGSAWDSIPNEISMKKWFLGPVFNVSF
jgi:hypothetical protein